MTRAGTSREPLGSPPIGVAFYWNRGLPGQLVRSRSQLE